MKLQKSVCTLAVVALGMGSMPASTQAMTPSEINAFSTQIQGLSSALARFAQSPSGQVLGWAGERSTTTPKAQVFPSCRMKSDKWVYKTGDTVKITWNTENAESGSIQVTDASGVTVSIASISSSPKEGSATWTATGAGLVKIVGSVQSSSKVDRTCIQTVSVVDAAASLKDSKVAGVSAAIAQKGAQIDKINNNIAELQNRLTKLNEEIAALTAQLTKIQTSTSTPREHGTSTRPMASSTAPYRENRGKPLVPSDIRKPVEATTTKATNI